MDLIKHVWNYAGDNRYLLVLLWIVGMIMIPVGTKVYKESKLATVIYIIYDGFICVVFTVLWFIYFWDKAKMSL